MRKPHRRLKFLHFHLREVLLEQAVHPDLGDPGRPALVGDVARLDEDALEYPHVFRTAEVEPGVDFGLEVRKYVIVVGHVGGQDEVGDVLRVERAINNLSNFTIPAIYVNNSPKKRDAQMIPAGPVPVGWSLSDSCRRS